MTRFPGSAPGACGPRPRSPRFPPLAPPPPRPASRRRSGASRLLWRDLTSHARASSASAPRLPDADQTAHRGPVAGREISRFPRRGACVHARVCDHAGPTGGSRKRLRRVAFRPRNGVGTRDNRTFVAQWLACTSPCRRFARALAGTHARLRADVVRYAFIVMDSHHLLLAGLPAHYGFRRMDSARPGFRWCGHGRSVAAPRAGLSAGRRRSATARPTAGGGGASPLRPGVDHCPPRPPGWSRVLTGRPTTFRRSRTAR